MHCIRSRPAGHLSPLSRNRTEVSRKGAYISSSIMAFAICILATALGPAIKADDASAVTPLKQAHAHNDYLHPRPLRDALDQGFGSVEADIFLKGDQLLIGHEERELKPERTLESLYLDPLRERIRAHGGWVYDPGFHFSLLIDVKTEADTTYVELDKILARYADILSVMRDGRIEQKAVTVVLSGNRARDIITKQSVRYVGIDGRPEDLSTQVTSDLMPWISARWGALFTWKGEGPLPAEERTKLIDLVTRTHQHGQQIRFWATPENELTWKELFSAKVDLINTDDLVGLRKFLLAQSAKRPSP